MDGFDHQSSKGWTPAVTSFISGRNGGSAMQPPATISFSPSRRIGFSPASHVFIGAAVMANSADFGSQSSSSLMVLGDNGSTTHLTVNYSATGVIQLRRGEGSGAIIATSAERVQDSVWHYLEIEATIADAGGVAKVRLNGVEVINFTGDTRNGGTATTIDGLGCGRSSGGSLIGLDDLYVCDDTGAAPYNTFLGDVTIPFRLADGNGALSQWVGSDGNSTDNYLLVDETVPNTSDYVASDVTGNRDLVTVQNMTSTTGTVLAAQTVIYGAKSDAGAANVKMLQRASTGTVFADATGQPLSTTYAAYGGEIRVLDPDGTAWTHTKINNLEVGVEVA
jgi:hypothetical protein